MNLDEGNVTRSLRERQPLDYFYAQGIAGGGDQGRCILVMSRLRFFDCTPK
ncbi:MAG TPA: hypothetical protein VKN76_13905 [Kiloniellaceae bacterium]|nr:hypothetical protein [Kiloniellaceae bacterium]